MATVSLTVDERTGTLSDAALYCRARGHGWEEKAISRSRFRDLLAQGLFEENYFCAICGGTLLCTYDWATGNLVCTPKRTYPTGDEGTGEYLLPKGSGRLPRAAARVARNARIYAGQF